ncbi:MAG: hypothetical protein HUK25_04490 [Treponema sp.]|nr:hypothetical protein [Treponema sp.]
MKKIIFLFLLFTTVISLNAFGKSDSRESYIQIEGVISLYGNEPHSFPGIKTSDGRKFSITSENKGIIKKINKLSGRKVLLTGYIRLQNEGKAPFKMLDDGYFVVEDYEVIKPKKNKR